MTSDPLSPADRSATELVYFELHYHDVTSRVAEIKGRAIHLAQWALTGIFGLLGLQALPAVVVPEQLVQTSIALICVACGALTFVSYHELWRHRAKLQELRERMGGWVSAMYPSGRWIASKWLVVGAEFLAVLVAGLVANVLSGTIGP